MYKLYVINQNQNGKECVLQHVYYDLFNHQHNIGFFQPKKYQFTICVGWTNKTTEEKEASREEYDTHILAKEQCRKKNLKIQLKEEKESLKSVVMIYKLYYKLHVGTLTCFTIKEN